MGFLKTFGRPLDFEESKQHFDKIRNSAVLTIIDWINTTKVMACSPKFGYEVEIHMINIDEEKKLVQINLEGEEVVKNQIHKEINFECNTDFTIHFEYGKWMIECVPRSPFMFNQILKLEKSINSMYSFFDNLIGRNKALFISSFPMLGVTNKESSFYKLADEEMINYNLQNEADDDEEEYLLEDTKDNPFSQSNQIDDIIINSHPRFGTLSRNIRKRRGNKVDIKIPIFMDVNTNLYSDDEPYPGFIQMDAMAFGMGSCCLQITMGTCSLQSTSYVYDQFLPITPILLALSSSGPIYKGKLSEHDNRFDVISQSVDDRTEEERNPLSSKYIHKSRYSPSYSYISDNVNIQEFHNDYPKFPINQDYHNTMTENGISKRLATHFCNLLVRDPLVIFEKKIEITDKTDRSHFENFNSTNWNSLRFKPPRTEDNDNCFKVEVRPCDLQLTALENAAILNLVLSIYGAILNFDVNFIIPISLVDKNFERAYKMNSVTSQKYFWRVNGIDKTFTNISSQLSENKFLYINQNAPITLEEDMNNIKELTIKEIFFGSEEYDYPGILKMCYKVIEEKFTDEKEIIYLRKLLEFMSKRATGELLTDAKYIRNFVLEHPKYNKDSIVTDEINYDLITHLLKIQNGELHPEILLGNYTIV